ncbi:MAG: hypothetical protein ACI867_001437, partial [Glaciecola sp.]
GFYGDRFDAAREMLTGGSPDRRIDVLTGDYLAELTMLILWRSTLGKGDEPAKDRGGYAKTFVHQMRDCLAIAKEQGTKIVVNAGGLNPAGLADALRSLAAELGVDTTIAHVEGDDLLARLPALSEAHALANLDTGEPLSGLANAPLTANAYLGAWGIKAALDAGADVVVTGRVTDASLVVGPAAWHHGWDAADLDALAGAVVAGHVIECGCQATGGNYPFFTEVPGLEHPGFPIAEVAADGSSVITKHEGTGGLVSVGTVTAQLLYEIGEPRYLGPDVTTDFRTIELGDDGPDRVRISGVRGTPATPDLKVCINTLGGFKNEMTFLLTGLDIEAKADLVRRTVAAHIDLGAIDEVDWQLSRRDQPDASVNALATATLRLVVKDANQKKVGRRAFSSPLVELALATYPGATFTAPPGDAEPYGIYWPTLVPKAEVHEVVVLADGTQIAIEQSNGEPLPEDASPSTAASTVPARTIPASDDEEARMVPLGTLLGARSGDKGGNANVGLWARDDEAAAWLAQVATADWVRTLLPEAADLEVFIHPLPNLRAVNVVIVGLLGDGVSSSTRPDPQAKGLAEFLRSRQAAIPTRLLA